MANETGNRSHPRARPASSWSGPHAPDRLWNGATDGHDRTTSDPFVAQVLAGLLRPEALKHLNGVARIVPLVQAGSWLNGANLVAALQGRHDDLEHRLHRSDCVVAVEPGAIGDVANQFLLVHRLAAPGCVARLARVKRVSLRQESAGKSKPVRRSERD